MRVGWGVIMIGHPARPLARGLVAYDGRPWLVRATVFSSPQLAGSAVRARSLGPGPSPGTRLLATMVDLANLCLFLFDIDGVFLEGKEQPRLLSGRRIVAALRKRTIPFRLVTNTSTHSPEQIAATLGRLGVQVEVDQIHSAVETTVAVAARRFPAGRCFAVAEPPVCALLEAAGLRLVQEAPADVVVVALCRNADYQMLSAAARCVLQGATLLACHRNRVWLDEKGYALSAGPWAAALEYATQAQAEIFGKPTAAFYDEARRPFGVAAAQTLMIGDDVVADVRGAQNAGLRAGLVLTGKTRRDELDRLSAQPDLVLEQVDDLADLLDAASPATEGSIRRA
jgi:HAD superfamily hydrolase (TIGR01458 family)